MHAGRLRSGGGSNRGHAIGDMQPHHVSALPAGALRRLREEMIAEQRMRLIAGMKRYAHRKRHEGEPPLPLFPA